MRYEMLDLFAGPGGWDEGAKSLGITSLGVEIDGDACNTAVKAGHSRMEADVLDVHPDDIVRPSPDSWSGDLLVASPPCVGFSKLNKDHGRKYVDEISDAVRRADWRWGRGDLAPTLLLPLVMGSWIEHVRPLNIAFEQVPSVLPVWEAYADVLRDRWGYSVWTGKLDAADYGVPQHRTRAFLMAQRSGNFSPPTPTCVPGNHTPTVAQPLGWTEEEVLTWTGDHWRLNDQSGTPFDALWPFKRPALTIAGRNLLNHPGANANRFNGKTKSRNDGYWLTEPEMAVLQGFPRDYPFQGTRSSIQKQIGNCVPPPMAAAVIGALL
jgi:DNA (cytosine-5)-methyltransferase 1